LNTLVSAGTAREFRLVDSFGFPINHDPVPFEYADAWKCHEDDEPQGLDFAGVEIVPYYRRILETNGVVAVTEDHWRQADYLRYEDYFILGLPEDSIRRSICQGADGRI